MVLSAQRSSAGDVPPDATPPPRRSTIVKITRSASAFYQRLSTKVSPASAAGESPAQKSFGVNISAPFDDKRGRVQPRFSEAKKAIWKDSMRQSWTEVLTALKEKAEQMESLGSKASNAVKDALFELKVQYHRQSQGFTTTNCRKDCLTDKSQKLKRRVSSLFAVPFRKRFATQLSSRAKFTPLCRKLLVGSSPYGIILPRIVAGSYVSPSSLHQDPPWRLTY